MFPSFIGILDIQSWWEVPSIAYFCSLFRTAFNLLDFDIEELEEALLTDGSEECASTLLTELIVRLLNGCLGNNDISAFNYQMFLRRLFRQKCQETGRYNPFNTDIDFQFLPLRTKVEILYALCDFRLDAEDVFELFKNLEAESLRVEPLGWDDNSSTYWYFYGTRLYREDYKQKSKNKKKKNKEEKRKRKLFGDGWRGDEDTDRVWQVVCFTEADWNHLTEKFKSASSRVEKELYQSLSENFLPEIPRLFQEKERLQRKRLLELAPRRTSNRVLQKIKQKEEDKPSDEAVQEIQPVKEEDIRKGKIILGREYRAKRREQLRSKSVSSESSEHSAASESKIPQEDTITTAITKEKMSKNPSASQKRVPEVPVKTGRKTNNSLACATGQIVIPDTVDSGNSTRKKLKTSQIFSQSEEDIQTDMYKVLEQLTAHEDAWPFMDAVEEEYAPNYYAVIRRPMDLKKMEERLDNGYYHDFAAFKGDFKLIVNNCRLYNGQDNEYTVMVDSLQDAFDRLTERYINRISSSDEEIAVEYQIQTPSRKHKIKQNEDSSPNDKKKRKRTRTNSENPPPTPERDIDDQPPISEKEVNSPDEDKIISVKEKHKSKEGKVKKKHKQHHHHGKHSRSHKKTSRHKSLSRKEKHLKKLEKKKEKHRKKILKQSQKQSEIVIKRSSSQESLESSNRSRSASPLPSIHTPSPSITPSPSPSPSPPPSDQLTDPDFFKDKYDKIKERRRHANKDNWDNIVDYKQKNIDKQKQNLSIPDKDKNQKLKETIEKLKAKNEKYKETLIFNNLFSASSQTSADKSSISSETQAEVSPMKDLDQYEFADESDQGSQKSQPIKKVKESLGKKAPKKISAAKNESATEALEQAVKDISKWLDDAPKAPTVGSPNDSPAETVSTEDSRLDDDFTNDKNQLIKAQRINQDLKKRPSSREPKIPLKRRELQRTIERLQPGKSKGNLITNSPTSKGPVEEVVPLGPHNKPREIKSVLTTKVDELSPKLSLGSVLPAVGFTLGKDHKFSEEELKHSEKVKSPVPIPVVEKVLEDSSKTEDINIKPIPEPIPTKKKAKEQIKELEKESSPKFSQEKATPNLSAWFKAFGAPKSTPASKRKNDETEQEQNITENIQTENKLPSPKNIPKYDSPPNEISPTPEGGDSPIPNVTATPRQRRTSTGSSISERSSFSQDLDSPRHQIAHSSPLLRSPASPRTDSDFQKITYPIINGTVRAGFYQDTASIKSSPEKSCSPREAPQSPYSPYSQHVYATNNAAAAAPTASFFIDHNKSPLPTYGLNQPPPYYDSSKAPVVSKTSRSHDDYTALGPDTSYQQTPSQLAGAYSPAPSPYSQHSQHSPYSHVQSSPQTIPQNSPAPIATISESKSSLYPVKKRGYKDAEISFIESKSVEQINDPGDVIEHLKSVQNKDDVKKRIHTIIDGSSEFAPTSVDDIALALGDKKMEAKKISVVTDKAGLSYLDEQLQNVEIIPNNNGVVIDKEDQMKQGIEQNTLRTDKLGDGFKTASIDMVNMGYFVSELERKSTISDTDLLNIAKDFQKSNLPKGLDIGAIAMDLGVNKTQLSTNKVLPNLYNKVQSPIKMPKGTGGNTTDKNELISQNMFEYDYIHNAEERKSTISDTDLLNIAKDLQKTNLPKFDIGAIAMDLGVNKTPLSTNKVLPNLYNKVQSPIKLPKGTVGNDADKTHNEHISQNMFEYDYMQNPEERERDILKIAKDLQKTTLPKGFDIGAIAMDLGVNRTQSAANKTLPNLVKVQSPLKVPKGTAANNMDKTQNEHVSQNMFEYDYIQNANTNVLNFNINGFDSSNKKLYSEATAATSTAIDYGNWKGDNQIRKPEPAHSNYQNSYSIESSELGKLKANINQSNANSSSYNKPIHSQPMQALTGVRAPMLRSAMQHNLQSELRIPNPRGVMKSDFIGEVSMAELEFMARNNESNVGQKSDKGKQNSSNALPYKTPYSNNNPIPLETLRNIPSLPQMLERYTNDDRYLSSFGSGSSTLYNDKTLQMAQMFNKSIASDIHPTSNSSSIYSQPMTPSQVTQADSKPKGRRKRTTETKHTPISGNQNYHSQPSSEVLSSVKPSLVPGSAFNFGPTAAGMGLSGSLYSDNSGFSLEDFRNTTANQFMAANYMAAAAAAHQRNTSDTNAEKVVKPAHQNSSAGTFPFIGHGQVRAGYPFGGVDSSSPLYQQYLQHHQEELLRQTGAQIMGLYPPGYHPSGLGARQPYDSMNRHSWL